jgi:hypothetical protein
MRRIFLTPLVGTVCAVMVAVGKTPKITAHAATEFLTNFNICIVLLLE